MKIFARLANNQIVILRQSTVSGNLQAFATVTTELFNKQSVSPERTELFGGIVGKTYVFSCDGVIDVQEGDKFRDVDTSILYKVVSGGVTRKTHGSIDYLEIIAQEIS